MRQNASAMRQLRLFISHGLDKSSKADMRFLDALHKALEQPSPQGPRIQVLLDRVHLTPGLEWREVLHDMLAQCDAALLLLNSRALDSPWVLKESTVLAYRKAMDPRFALYPALLGLPSSNVLAGKDFSPLALRELQALKGKEKPAELARALKTLLAQAPAGEASPLDRLVQALKSHLDKAESTAPLEALCDRVSPEPLAWKPGAGERKTLVADTIARALVRGLCSEPSPLGVEPLATLVDELRVQAGMRAADVADVLALAHPLWVNPDAAALLADVAGRNRAAPSDAEAGLSVALPTALPAHAADCHVRRALLPAPMGSVYTSLAGGESDTRLEDLQAAIRREVRRQRPQLQLTDEQIDERLRRTDNVLRNNAASVFFAIPAPLPDAGLLARLQQLYPRVTFILQAPLGAAALPPKVLPLPALPERTDERMYDDYCNARNALGLA